MQRKSLIWVGMAVGSTLGGYLPALWGGSLFSMISVFLAAVGGILGIYVGFRLSENI